MNNKKLTAAPVAEKKLHIYALMSSRHITSIDVNHCIDLLTDIYNQNVFMIISDAFSKHIISLVHETTHLDSIFIFCVNETRYEQ